MRKVFNNDHIMMISKLNSILSNIEVKDVFIGQYFIAFLVNKKPDKISIKLAQMAFDKKLFFYEYKDNPIDFIRQFARGKFEPDGDNTIKIRIAKQFFHAMVWFLKRNYKESNFTFKFG